MREFEPVDDWSRVELLKETAQVATMLIRTQDLFVTVTAAILLICAEIKVVLNLSFMTHHASSEVKLLHF